MAKQNFRKKVLVEAKSLTALTFMTYVSRAGEKLAHALKTFRIDPTGMVCADFGSSTGGFVDYLVQNKAAKVYAIDTGYGVLDWKLRNDARVVVLERKNAMHVNLPEKMDLITIDVGWTKLSKVVSNALKNLKETGQMVALLKPHYEAQPKMIRSGKLLDKYVPEVVENVKRGLANLGAKVLNIIESPLLGGKAGNKEYLLLIKP